MNQEFKKYLIYWFFIVLIGLVINIIIPAIDINLITLLLSFLVVVPFLFVSRFLMLYIAYQIPNWAKKYNKKTKMTISVLSFICVYIINFLPCLIMVIVFSLMNNESMKENGNLWPFNIIGVICFYFIYIVLNTIFLIYNHSSKKNKKVQIKE